VDVSLLHTFVGCNRVVGALDWGENGLIAFAAHNAVALYDVGRQRILGTLLGHGDRVNCVRWLDTMTLVSGSADGSLCLHRRSIGSGTATSNWTLVARSTPPAPGAPITFIAGTKWAMTNANETADVHVLIVTSGDGSVGVWTVDWNAAQTLVLQRVDQLVLETAALPTCAAIMRPSTTTASDLPCLLVAVGCVDGEVRLYTCHPPFSLKLACRLPGHSNWVRGVAFTSTRSSDNSSESILLASASQDRTVRLWRLVDCGERMSTHDAECSVLTRFAPKPHFTINGITKYEAHVEALLLGHEDWVLSVAWQPRQSLSGHTATLLTTSMDRTMMLWVRDEKTGE
jgi:elongator complex protein 2